MKIVHICTYDITGGAAIAANRLNQALNQIGHDSKMLVLHKKSLDPNIKKYFIHPDDEFRKDNIFSEKVIQRYAINLNRNSDHFSAFSLSYSGYDISKEEIVKEADIINLHWISYFVSPMGLDKLFSLNKPIIWTLHDQRAMTGGCHYSSGCNKYFEYCQDCPQINKDNFEWIKSIYLDQKEIYEKAPLFIISPSKWLKDCARKSALLREKPIEVISNSVPLNQFFPIDKSEAKHKFNIKSNTYTLLFIAQDIKEQRKGFKILIAVLKELVLKERIQNLLQNNRLKLLIIGDSKNVEQSIDIPYVDLGILKSVQEMNLAYNAADIFILPSLEDNLPNTMLEAMSSSTCSIAFDTGGISDFIVNGETGALISLENYEQLANSIDELLHDSKKRILLGRNARSKIVQECSPQTQAKRYIDFYKKALNSEIDYRSIYNDLEGMNFGKNFNKIYDEILIKYFKRYYGINNGKLKRDSLQKNKNNESNNMLNKIKNYFRNKILGFLFDNIDVILDRSEKIAMMEKYLSLMDKNSKQQDPKN